MRICALHYPLHRPRNILCFLRLTGPHLFHLTNIGVSRLGHGDHPQGFQAGHQVDHAAAEESHSQRLLHLNVLIFMIAKRGLIVWQVAPLHGLRSHAKA